MQIIKPFLYYSFTGLQMKMAEALNIDPPQLSTVTDIQNLLISPEAKQITQFPISFFRFTSIDVQEDYNVNRTSIRAQRLTQQTTRTRQEVVEQSSPTRRPINSIRGQALAPHPPVEESVYHTSLVTMIPVQLEFELTLLSNAYEHLLDFSTRWIFASIKHRLDFIIEYYGQEFPVSSVLDTNLTVPTKDSVFSDLPDYYQLTATFTTQTWLTNADGRDQMDQAPLIKTTSFETKVGT